MKNQTRNIALGLNVTIFVLEIIGMVLSVEEWSLGLFQFYTQDSNILLMIASGVYIISDLTGRRKGKTVSRGAFVFKYVATCCVTVTFVVVVCVLAPLADMAYGIMLFHGTMLYHHFLCPILAFVSFVFFEKEYKVMKRNVDTALIPTIIYAITLIVLNIMRKIEGPYPFLHVYEQPVYMSVVWCVVIIGGAYVFAQIIRKINNAICQKKS